MRHMAKRIAVVTGGAGGIGSAVCRSLAEGGMQVNVADIDFAAAQTAAAGLPGADHAAWPLDVTQESSVAAVFQRIEGEKGPIAVLVCAAGGSLITPDYRPRISGMSTDFWDRTATLNARGTFLCIRQFLLYRESAPLPDARVIALASLAGQTGGSSQTDAAYGAAKASIMSLIRNAAVQGAPFGVTANAVAPGLIDTERVRAAVTPKQREATAAQTPLQRLGETREVAEVIAFLASPQSSFVTGQTVSVNGGRFMN
jgi:NAD(P)-dependent dehydrogenase (short-subunit alcohol dehydrogenase family)